MGTSSAQINDEIEATRNHLDANLDVLEKRATAGLKRAAVIGGIGLATGVIAGTIFFITYRRLRKPTMRERVQKAMPDLSELQKELKKRFGNRPVKVVITSGDAGGGGGVWESTLRRVAPGLISSVAGAIMAAAIKRRSSGAGDQTEA